MKKIKTQRGITLIALIITIVVLLILAGVAIGTLQESNIIGRAKDAASSYEKEKTNENEVITATEDMLNKIIADIESDEEEKEEVPVWAVLENASTGEKILCYIGEEKELRLTSNKLRAEWVEPTENGELNRTGKIKYITLEETIGIYLFFAPNLEKADLGNILPNNYVVLGMSSQTLKELTGLRGVKVFDNDSFASCENLELIEFPETTTTIISSAFNSCKSLKNITIPASVTSIGNSAFLGCRSLTEVTIKKTKAEVEAEGGIGTAWIPDSVTKIIYSDQTVELN